MRRVLVVAPVIACATIRILGCSRFGGGADPGPSDAAARAMDGSNDARGPGSAEGAAPVDPCAASTHAYCDDFDRDAGDAAPPWGTQGKPTTTTARSYSAPSSTLFSLPRQDDDTNLYSSIAVDVAGSWRRAVLEFEVYLEAPSWKSGDSNFGLFCIAFNQNGSTDSDGSCLSISETDTEVGIHNGGDHAPFQDRMPYDQWVHVKADIDPAGRLLVQLGNRADPFKLSFSSLVQGSDPYMTIQVGLLGYNAPAPAATAYFDDVTIDFP